VGMGILHGVGHLKQLRNFLDVKQM